MWLTRSILLLSGLFSLYVSMTCTLVPNLLGIPFSKNNSFRKSNFVSIGSEEFQEIKEKTKLKLHDGIGSNSGVGSTFDLEAVSSNFLDAMAFIDIPTPVYTRGIYITNSTAQSEERIKYFLEKANFYELNTFVIDVQKQMVSKEIIGMLKTSKIFPVARVVVMEGGLRQKEFSNKRVHTILKLIEDASAQGFSEVQLDYIRYADIDRLLGLPLSYKYNIIRSLLSKAKNIAEQNNIHLSADLFGRITLNQNDQIGQKLEIFGKYMRTIYPMLYPSHYTNDNNRISKPYMTVKEGIEKSKERLPEHRIVAYIQGFNIKVKPSRLNFVNYIKAQIKACDDSFSDGWVIWNARNEYGPSFQAIKQYKEEKTALKNQTFSNRL